MHTFFQFLFLGDEFASQAFSGNDPHGQGCTHFWGLFQCKFGLKGLKLFKILPLWVRSLGNCKEGRVFKMTDVLILPHAELGQMTIGKTHPTLPVFTWLFNFINNFVMFSSNFLFSLCFSLAMGNLFGSQFFNLFLLHYKKKIKINSK